MTTMIKTSMGTFTSSSILPQRIPEGRYTATIYAMIRDEKYLDVVRVLTQQLMADPRSRPALSLLGYCYYHMGDYNNASAMYEQLCRFYPEQEEYKVYYAQSLYKANMYEQACKVAVTVDNIQYQQRMLHLQAYAEYEMDDFVSCKSHLSQCLPDDPDTIVASGCVLIKEEQYEEACAKFQEAMRILGYQPELSYNIALCCYKTKQLGPATKYIAEIVDRGVREHPELSLGAASIAGVEVRSVGNSAALKATALVEACNLRAAIEYSSKNYTTAQEHLSDMPPRSEEELDPVTLHNQALMHMDEEPTAGFKKLNFLLSQPPFPPETFGNLLLLYCKYGYYDLAADVMAENVELTTSKHLSPDLYAFLDATIQLQTAPEEAYAKYDELASRHIEQLRKLTKQISDARTAHDSEGMKRAIKEFDDVLENYIPVLMAMARIYWDLENYPAVEKLLRQSAEYCSENDTWKLNIAHVFFMQDQFKEAIKYYELFEARSGQSVLQVSAMVLANLCVSHIMTSKNNQAEDLLRKVEKEEERASYEEPDKNYVHLCIINLVIGTLYCAKGNFEFGISRVIKSLEPINKKLQADTWHYAKRCLLGLVETLAKHMIMVKDQTFHEIISFLDQCEVHGKNVSTLIAPTPDLRGDIDREKKTVAYEARCLKRLYIQLRD